MEVLTGFCKKCKGELIRAKNSWNGIGTTYFSPVHAPLSTRGIGPIGQVYEATRGTRVENSQLQDVACMKCRAIIGVRCEDSPDDHLLKSGQLLLKLSEMTVISEGSGRAAKISILQTQTLSNAHSKKLLASRRACTAQPSPRPLPLHLQPKTAATPGPTERMSVRPEIKKPQNVSRPSTRPEVSHDHHVNSVTRPSSTNGGPLQAQRDNSQLATMEKFQQWAENTISTQQKNIDRISGAIDRIEGDMKSLKDFIQEVRTELRLDHQAQERKRGEDREEIKKEIEQLQRRIGERNEDLNSQIQQVERQNELFEVNSANHEDLLKGIRREVSQLKVRMDKGDLNSDLKTATVLLGDKLELVSRDLSRVGNKAKAVDDLKILFGDVAGRLQQIERAVMARPAPQLSDKDVQAGQSESAPTLKRTQSQMNFIRTPSVERSPELPTKRRRLREPRPKAIDFCSDVPSPILGRQIVEDTPYYEEPTIPSNKENNSPRVVIYVPTSPPVPENFTPASDPIPRRSKEIPTSEPKPIRKLVADEVNNRRISLRGVKKRRDPSGKWRDRDGNIVLGDGRIDRRSLRYKKDMTTESTLQPPIHKPAPTSQHGSEKEISSVMQSVEKDDVVSISCSECGKAWKSMEQFNEHKCFPRKTYLQSGEEASTARQSRLAARERLVRATLEREL